MKQLCNLWGIELNKKRISDVAFVLHVRAYRESSLLIDFFTRHFGKVTSIAKGVKRPKSLLRSVLLPTTLLNISLVGRKDLKNLTHPFEYNKFDDLLKIVKKYDIGTIKMEVSRNQLPSKNFLREIRNLCNKKKII